MRCPIPLAAVRTFEAAARQRSFKDAASELNLTASAVGHAIRKLEAALGVIRFTRDGSGISLTAAGEALLDHVSCTLEEMNRGFDLVATHTPQLLRLHCAPSFAAQ
ncbi:LysR family transcriptional regulator PerR [Methylorubrum populi]|uniref:LysR family transcriptional regulator PerR n=1 Tax=Methylorubrum populi TaxID=223967 RepID=A0A833J1F0_9HYPH|nr:LysR family transcriptional regulator PerR [Methylorubrum populi]